MDFGNGYTASADFPYNPLPNNQLPRRAIYHRVYLVMALAGGFRFALAADTRLFIAFTTFHFKQNSGLLNFLFKASQR